MTVAAALPVPKSPCRHPTPMDPPVRRDLELSRPSMTTVKTKVEPLHLGLSHGRKDTEIIEKK